MSTNIGTDVDISPQDDSLWLDDECRGMGEISGADTVLSGVNDEGIENNGISIDVDPIVAIEIPAEPCRFVSFIDDTTGKDMSLVIAIGITVGGAISGETPVGIIPLTDDGATDDRLDGLSSRDISLDSDTLTFVFKNVVVDIDVLLVSTTAIREAIGTSLPAGDTKPGMSGVPLFIVVTVFKASVSVGEMLHLTWLLLSCTSDTESSFIGTYLGK